MSPTQQSKEDEFRLVVTVLTVMGTLAFLSFVMAGVIAA